MKEDIKNFILSVGANDSSSALDTFNDIMGQKVYDAIESRRQEVSGSMFQEVEEASEQKTFTVKYRKTGSGAEASKQIKAADAKEARAKFASQNKGKYHDIFGTSESVTEENELNEVDKKYHAQAKAIVAKKYPGFELGSLGLGKNGVLNVEIIRTKDGFTKEFTMDVKD